MFLCRHSIVRQLTEDGAHHMPVNLSEKLAELNFAGKPKLIKQTTILELETTDLAPKVEGRIKVLDAKVSSKLLYAHHRFSQENRDKT